MNSFKVGIAIPLVLAFTGCASITGTTGQSVSVETRLKDKQVVGASCELANSRGKWYVTTPGSTQIRRSNEELLVLCTKDGVEPGGASVISDTKGSMFGNILFGGGIGAIIDHSNGSAYEYPTVIQVMMGQTITIGTPPQTSATASQSNVPPAFRTDSAATPTQAIYSKPTVNPAAQLEQIDELKKKGLITQDEYASKKAEILKSL